jgi:type VI secretion system secreted protein Hcp
MASAFETYLQLDGIQGEASEMNHKNWIRVMHFSHGVFQEGTGAIGAAGRRVVGKCIHGDFNITKQIDRSTPYLNRECCSGKHIPRAIVEIVATTNNKKEVILRYTFDQVVIKSVDIVGGDGQQVPMENVKLEYSKIKWEYNMVGNDGQKTGNTMAEHNLATSITA